MTPAEAVVALVDRGFACDLDRGVIFGGRVVLPASGNASAWHGSFVIEPKGGGWSLRFTGEQLLFVCVIADADGVYGFPEWNVTRLEDAVEKVTTISRPESAP